MNAPHSQDKLARGRRLLSHHMEVPQELCFDLSALIAASIKMFFRNTVQARQGPGELLEASARLQLCVACSVDEERVRGGEAESLGSSSGEQLNKSARCVLLSTQLQMRSTFIKM